MSRMVKDFISVLNPQKEVFDCYFTNSEHEARKYFHLKDNPEMMPFVIILDPKKNTLYKT